MLLAILKKPEDLQPAEKLADGIEIRADCLTNIQACKDILSKTSLPVMFTVRKKSQGGFFSGSEEERLNIIEELFSLKPHFFDLEYDTEKTFIEKMHLLHPEVKIICSYHNFTSTPEDLSALLESMRSPVFYGYKIAVVALSTLDALRMLLFVKQQKEKGECIAGMTMGEKGQISRILGPVFGSLFTYAPVDKLSALPGQLTLLELHDIYNYKSLGPETSIYGLIGNLTGKSIGHYVHNKVMNVFRMDAVYCKMDILNEELKEFFLLANRLKFAGLSVTMPLKELVMPFLDEIDPEAKMIGAVNTISFDGGKLHGFNADGRGAIEAIEQKISLQGKVAIILGAGGSAKAIAHVACQNGASIVILNRSRDKAQELACLVNGQSGSLDEMARYYEEGYDVLINCTSAGLPIDPKYILPNALIMDISIHPKDGLLLPAAKQKGAKVVFGYEMFINQAGIQQEIWFKKKINKEKVKEVIASTALTHLLY